MCCELAEEGWRAFLCAVREEEIREEEIREESRRVAALAASERDEPDAVEDDGNIPMFPIGAPLSHSANFLLQSRYFRNWLRMHSLP